MNKKLSLITVVLIVISMFAGISMFAKDIQISVIVKTTNSDYWQVVNKGAIQAAKDMGVKMTFDGPSAETAINEQVNMMENAISKKVDAIILAPCDVKALVPVVKKAEAAKIPVIIIDTKLDYNTVAFLTTDNVAAGAVAAKLLIEKAGKTGKIAIMSFVQGAGSAVDREKGFVDYIKKNSSLVIVGTYYSNSDMPTALNQTTDVLNANKDLVGIFGANEPTAIGMGRAIEEKGLKGKIVAVGFDGAPKLQEFVKNGVLQAIVVQSPYNMGFLGIKTALDAINKKKVNPFVDTGVFGVTTTNISSADAQKALGN
jgi:ribose transport system substrate-binding protein